jgi:hypothetical protein
MILRRFTRLSVVYCLLLISTPTLHSQDSAENASYFGKREKTGSALIGIFYDLKQDQKGNEVTSNRKTYQELMSDFLNSGWDEGLLRPYYKASRPLYATQIFIPFMSAAKAPDAFGVADRVKPSNWLVHYKGQVSPPQTGKFRFVGGSDDVLIVAINGETLLIGNHPAIRFPDLDWDWGKRDGPRTPSGKAVNGKWFEASSNEIYDIDIITGEIPGGQYGAWLWLEKFGVEYEKIKGQAKLPIFQVAKRDFELKGNLPEYRDLETPWTSHQ